MGRWKEIILITILIKILLFEITGIVHQYRGMQLIDSWVRWDGSHYVDIAQNWYQTVGDPANFIVFYPLYPLLIKLVAILTNNFNLGALTISWTFSIISSIILFELAMLDFSKRVSILSVWFLNIFPTSFFLQAGYTESLFLGLSLLSIYLYRKHNFMAGIAGFFSALTRVNGLILIPYYFFETLQQTINPKKFLLLCLISLLTLSGFLIYLLINFTTFGDFTYFIKPLGEHWYKNFTWPWMGIKQLISFTYYQQGELFYLFWGELLAIIFVILFTIYTFFKIRKSYGFYMLANLIFFISTGFIMSTPRYILILFPIYFALGKLKNLYLIVLISSLFIILLIYLSLLYTQGGWAY